MNLINMKVATLAKTVIPSVFLAFSGANVMAASDDPGSISVVKKPSEKEEVQPLTIEDMEKAQPVEMPVLPPLSDEELQEIEEQQLDEVDKFTIEPVLSNYGKVRKADVTKNPYRKAGKLWIKKKGVWYTCTAQFVGKSDIVLTAAHCLENKGDNVDAEDVQFYRAYKSGASYDQYNWKCYVHWSGWHGNNNPYRWDYAFVKVDKNSSAGAMGLKGGVPYGEWESVGYPDNFFGGKEMAVVRGKKGWVKDGVAQMKHNPMTFGASGGGWIGESKYAISVNSHLRGDANTSKELYGSVFDKNTTKLYEAAQKCDQ